MRSSGYLPRATTRRGLRLCISHRSRAVALICRVPLRARRLIGGIGGVSHQTEDFVSDARGGGMALGNDGQVGGQVNLCLLGPLTGSIQRFKS